MTSFGMVVVTQSNGGHVLWGSFTAVFRLKSDDLGQGLSKKLPKIVDGTLLQWKIYRPMPMVAQLFCKGDFLDPGYLEYARAYSVFAYETMIES